MGPAISAAARDADFGDDEITEVVAHTPVDLPKAPELAARVAELDMLYPATANAEGQSYIQHRGGPRGFPKVLDDKILAFADLGGNRQLLPGATSRTTRAHSCS